MPIYLNTYLLERNVKSAREAARILHENTAIHNTNFKSFAKTNNNFNSLSNHTECYIHSKVFENKKFDLPRSFNKNLSKHLC